MDFNLGSTGFKLAQSRAQLGSTMLNWVQMDSNYLRCILICCLCSFIFHYSKHEGFCQRPYLLKIFLHFHQSYCGAFMPKHCLWFTDEFRFSCYMQEILDTSVQPVSIFCIWRQILGSSLFSSLEYLSSDWITVCKL